jgi:hypothetical protein
VSYYYCGTIGFSQSYIRNAFELAEGFYLLAATTAAEVAHEMPEKRHGAFSGFLIEAISGAADLDAKGFVTTDDVRDYVEAKTREWAFESGKTDEIPNAAATVTGAFILADFR